MDFQAAIYRDASYKNCVFVCFNKQSIRSFNPTFNTVDGKNVEFGRLIIERVDIEKAVEEINSAGIYSFELIRTDKDIRELHNTYNELQNLLDRTPDTYKYYIEWNIFHDR